MVAMVAVLAAFLLSRRSLGLCLVGWSCTGHLFASPRIFPLGISVSLPSPGLNVISVCVSTWEAGSLEGFLSSLRSVFSLTCCLPPPPPARVLIFPLSSDLVLRRVKPFYPTENQNAFLCYWPSHCCADLSAVLISVKPREDPKTPTVLLFHFLPSLLSKNLSEQM